MNTDEFRTTGHRVVDLLAEYLDTVEDRPLFPDIAPSETHAQFDEPIPDAPMGADAVIDEIERKLLPGCTHVMHPGYFGLITPSPLPAGALADFIASTLNQNVGTYTIGPSAVAMERRVVRWLCDLCGYGASAGGNLTSGGTMANALGLKLGRDWASGQRAQHDGLRDAWAVYTSEERHVSVDKAVDAAGMGRSALRALPTDQGFRLRIDALEEAIARDKANGVRPMAIVAMAGTTNTGAVDDLRTLREIADREHMWLHADAAYGGGMLISKRSPGLLDGVELADSVTIDPHKWFYAPLDVGAILVRDAEQLTRSYGMKPSYLTDELDEGDRYQYYVHGFEQSRRFRGLKVWMSFKRYGTSTIAGWIDDNVEHARRLHTLAEAHPRFVCANDPTMSAICLRFEPEGEPDENVIGRLHATVARRIEESGRFWISTAVLKDKWWFRVCPVNYRTRLEHIDELFELLVTECEAQIPSAC